ncbi:hypothetical protein CK203_027276 [Vitis vinifera]|uniref:Uncharacterized protein n=1 Tax=Vitis vinifera TaxID=29760 RepID=A0A438J9I9_VITVI|nr:hypothetical protein CK203_027276 [Vitis vinifera]
MRDATQEEETAISKKTWFTLFPPGADRRQGHRCCSEPIFTRGSSSSSEDCNMEEEFGMGLSDGARNQSESSLQMSSVCPDSPLTNPLVQFFPIQSLFLNPYGKPRHLKIFYEKGGVDYLNHGDIPDRVEEENQCALSNQMTGELYPKDSICQEEEQRPHRALRHVGFGSEGQRIRMFVMIQENKKENCDRRFVGSVWTVRNKDWVALPASGASGGILIIWDSKNLRREEVVIGSFSVSVKFSLDGCGPLWISAVYGPNSPSLRKDFGWELLTFMD